MKAQNETSNVGEPVKAESPKPIAYRQGQAGQAFHLPCWDEHSKDYHAKTGCRPFLGTVYYPGAEQYGEGLYNQVCGKCGFSFERSTDGCRWLRLTTHADNGWQHHYPR